MCPRVDRSASHSLTTPSLQMMSLLSFLLPETDLPTLKDLACMVETDHSHEAYKSRRNSDFASWDSWEDELRVRSSSRPPRLGSTS